jgi:hypothetical protein
MAPAGEVVSNITLLFCLLKKRHWDENPAVRGGYGCHGQTRGVQTWVVGCAFENLLGVEILSKNALILHKNIHPLFHLAHPKYP